MSTEDKRNYNEAIRHLNGLFRSESLMVKVRQNRKYYREQNLPHMQILLRELSITQNDLDQLQVVHVTGTKGKGSTCTFIESILRHHGYKTLFYSSPHIRETRERVRICGQPLSYEKFNRYFWEVYNKLVHHKNKDGSLLHYYNFLMCLCVYVALAEKQLGNVEVVVIEAMLGGEYDYTNIFEDKAVCCMTSIELDHTEVIGPTVDDIAWYKSGIFRDNVTVISAIQPDSAMAVIRQRANEKGKFIPTQLAIEHKVNIEERFKSILQNVGQQAGSERADTTVTIAPNLNSFGEGIEIGIDGDVQKINAPIAILAARAWMHKHNQIPNGYGISNSNCVEPITKMERQDQIPNGDGISNNNCVAPITKMERQGLKNAEAFGKDLVVKFEGVTFYLDGAHTLESIQNCINWFDKKRILETKIKCGNVKRLLIFTIPPDRIPERLLTPLKDYPFDVVLFPAHLTDTTETSLDHHTEHLSVQERINLASETKQIWDQWNNDVIKHGAQNTIFCRSFIDCVNRLSHIRQVDKSSFFQVLVTGSIGMIGKFLKILDSAPENPHFGLKPVCLLNGTENSSI